MLCRTSGWEFYSYEIITLVFPSLHSTPVLFELQISANYASFIDEHSESQVSSGNSSKSHG